MRKLLITAGICLLIGIAFITAGAIMLAEDTMQMETLAVNQSLDTRLNAERIDIDAARADVQIVSTNTSRLRAQYTGTITQTALLEEPELVIRPAGDTLHIEVNQQEHVLVLGSIRTDRNTELVVEIPESYDKELSVYTTGDVRMADRSFTDLTIRSINGESILNDVFAQTLSFHTFSGSLEAQTHGDQAEFHSVSGGLTISGSASMLDVETLSGAVKVDGAYQQATVKTVSGSADLRGIADLTAESTSGAISAQTSGPARLTSTSGEVTVVLEEDADADLRFSTASGTSDIAIPLLITSEAGADLSGSFGDGGALIDVRTVSGDLRVRPE